ncbi:MAG: cache domain-containing protein [Sedimentisphaerales bacterium]|nr:cache domain-containing protein [Sedimentisphaerales bacterium]
MTAGGRREYCVAYAVRRAIIAIVSAKERPVGRAWTAGCDAVVQEFVFRGRCCRMKARKLKRRLLSSFFGVIAAFGVLVGLLGYYVIKKDILERAQEKVRNDLNSAREIYQQEVGRVGDVVRLTALRFFLKDGFADEGVAEELERIRRQESLDILTLTDSSGKVVLRSRNRSSGGDDQSGDSMVRRIIEGEKALRGTAVVPREDLLKEGEDLAERAHIRFVATPKAKARAEQEETAGMMIKAAAGVFGADGGLIGVLYGGKLLNRNYEIVDKVKETVYKGERYKDKDAGTATIFQRDLRVSTNVRSDSGSRAIGTRVSREVNEQVLEKGLAWVGRAFVVNAWYKTAYEPIRDVEGNIIGILYVGTLEQPFADMSRNIFVVFVSIVLGAMVLAGLLEYFLTNAISRPVRRMVRGTKRLCEGDLGYRVKSETGTVELDSLARSFNEMSEQLREREDGLKAANEELAVLNKRYLDLVGFVSHELKGILATTIMNAAAIRDGYFGDINDKQRTSIDAVMRNLNYLKQTVRKFLDLSRIEKGELQIKAAPLLLREDIFEPCLETFSSEIASRQMDAVNEIPAGLQVSGDIDLLQIAANNLVGNAIKYGLERGKIAIKFEDMGEKVRVEVYNDSAPIRDEDKPLLFRRFSRLSADEGKKVKGTGLGLFITKEIILKHGGEIWVEARERGNSFFFEIAKSC